MFCFFGGVQLKSDLVKEKPELSGTMHHGSQPQIQRLRDVFIKSLKNCIRVSSCYLLLGPLRSSFSTLGNFVIIESFALHN